VRTFSEQPIDWIVHLGDFIDMEYQSYQTVLPIWHDLKSPGYHVLGNHDFSINDKFICLS